MIVYVVRRLLQFIPILIGLVTVLFALLNILPGDPARMMAGPFANPDVVETIRQEMGFDRPLLVQYLDNLWNLAQGEFGRSYQSRRPILGDMLEVFSQDFSACPGRRGYECLLGIWLGVHRPQPGAMAGLTVLIMAGGRAGIYHFRSSGWPLMLQIVFAVFLRMLPFRRVYGAGFDRFHHLARLHPGTSITGAIARITRAALLEVMGEDYIRTARAKGLKATMIHAPPYPAKRPHPLCDDHRH